MNKLRNLIMYICTLARATIEILVFV